MAENNLWDKFDKAFDTAGLANDVKEAAENGTNYREVPHGAYEVEVNKLELVESKKGDPMVTVWFKVVDGEYKGCLIFMNQVITLGFQIHICNEILRQMTAELDGFNVEFLDYKQYGELLMDVHEAIDGKFEFKLDFAEGKKGFSTYSVDEIYILK
jgi:diaminopimelate epimerase